MKKRRGSRDGLAVLAALLIAVGGCGRSENVGWADREMPDSMPRGERELAAGAAARQEVPPTEREGLEREHQQLARSLSSLQRAAMADSQLAATWQALDADLEARLKETSEFHRQLLVRRDEIEARLAAASEGAQGLTDAERMELDRYYQNIEAELARKQRFQVREPEFAGRFAAFRTALFEKMRELDPARREQIDRLEMLDRLLSPTADRRLPDALVRPQP